MKRVSRLLVCSFPSLLFVLALAPAVLRGGLDSDVRKVLSDKALKKATIGVQVVRLGNNAGEDEVVFSHDSSTRYIPASNLKLITSAAALERLGADFKFRTRFAVSGGDTPDVALVGDGDPTFGDAKFLKKSGWGVTTVFETWAQELKRRGVTTVGDVLVDDSVFDQTFIHPNWPTDQLHLHYAAGVGGLNLNANTLNVTVRPTSPGQRVQFSLDPNTSYVTVRNTCVSGNKNGVDLNRPDADSNELTLRGQTKGKAPVTVQVTIHDPPMYAGTVLAETLGREGITVTGQVRRDDTVRRDLDEGGASWAALAIHQTPLSAVLPRLNKESVNLYAECLLKRVGFAATGQSGSWENGTAAMAQFMRNAGVDEGEFHFDDGCGLSKKNGVSPRAVCQILAREFHGDNAELFRTSLAVAGVDGTLDSRFAEKPVRGLRGRVWAKSGFVNKVWGLSGYLKGRDERWYAFSILINNAPGSGMKAIQEKIVKAVDDHAASVADGR